jgi:hemerythrin-like domain-containing protein
MLTTTYALVTVTAEQEKTSTLLQRLQHCLDASWNGLQRLDHAMLESGYRKFVQFDQYFRSRKAELYLIPTVRRIGQDAHALIAELESLSSKCAQLLRTAGNILASSLATGRSPSDELYQTLRAYCRRSAERLDLEIQVLLPMARRLLSGEDWFSLAATFLAREGGRTKRRAGPAYSRSASRLRPSYAD